MTMKPARVLRLFCLLLALILPLPAAQAEPVPYGEGINTFLKAMVEAKVLPPIDPLPVLPASPEFLANDLSINLTDFMVIYLYKDEANTLHCELYLMLADMPDSVDSTELFQAYLGAFDPALTDEEINAALSCLSDGMDISSDGYVMEETITLPGFDCTMTMGLTEGVETLTVLLPQP